MPGNWAVRHSALLILIAALGCIYVPWTWSDQLASMGGDSAVYVLAARDYSPFVGADAVAAAVAVESQFPPLYPVLLALTGAVLDLHAAHALTTVCLLAAFVAFYVWLTTLGIPRALAVITVALFAVMPGTYQQAFYLHSENLYLALSLGFLAVLSRAQREQRAAWYGWAVVLCAAALLARTAGLALLPALLLALLRGRPRRAPAMFVAAVLPAAAWGLLHRPEHSYSNSLLDRYAEANWPEIARSLVDGTLAIARGGVENLIVTTALAWPVIALGITALAIGVWRFVRAEPDAWYLFAYLAMVVIWPYPAEAKRFAWLTVPLLVGYLVWAGHFIGLRAQAVAPAARRLLAWVVPAILAMMVFPGFVLALERSQHPAVEQNPALRHLPEWYGIDPAGSKAQAELHLEFGEAIRALSAQIPPGECVFSIKPPLVAFYGNRDSFIPPFQRVDDATFDVWVRSKGCRYFLLIGAASPSFSASLYPLERMRDRLAILDVVTSRREGAEDRVIAALAILKDHRSEQTPP